MAINPKDLRIDADDQRKGMGIGGWDVLWTAKHLPTGCAVTWRMTGSYPQSPHKMRDRALMALELMTEVYDRSERLEKIHK